MINHRDPEPNAAEDRATTGGAPCRLQARGSVNEEAHRKGRIGRYIVRHVIVELDAL